MKKETKNSLLVTFILLVLTGIIRIASSISPHMTEKIYSSYIFPIFSFVLGNFSGIFPFSIIELIHILLVVFIFFFIIYCAMMLYSKKSIVKILNMILPIVASIILGFAALCMPNYLRLPIEARHITC